MQTTSSVVSIFSRPLAPPILWWEGPFNKFIKNLQELCHSHTTYFPPAEMEEIYNEVSLYILQRNRLWEDQLKLGISSEYLASDLTGYLHQVYCFLREDILDRKKTRSNVVAFHAPY